MVIDNVKLKTPHIRVPLSLFEDQCIKHPPCFLIYGELLNLEKKYSVINIGNKKLASLIGCKSITTVSKAVQELRQANYIAITTHTSNKKSFRTIKTLVGIYKNKYISIPLEVVHLDGISNIDKLVLGIIYTNAFLNGDSAIISNKKIAKLLGRSTRQVIRIINKLKQLEYITIEYPFEERHLNLNYDFFTSIQIQDDVEYWGYNGDDKVKPSDQTPKWLKEEL